VSNVPSLYRRHRPRSFADMVGQEPVVRTLRNAVQQGKVHHAYLFVGSRGTGKTSTAKILACCLNCEHGPTSDPCGACDSCRAIANATSLDVIEMDAASNNSVDDIRELRESVVFAPVSGRHKVYILDEAHMLSAAAWNAFLKTLEEPPPNTVFVLATTEAQKVPPTVVDRCHRFDFHRPTVEQIASVIRRAAESEKIQIPPEAVVAVARSATGSFRDALGTLEQLTIYSGNEIKLEDVLAVLGVADAALMEDVFEALAAGDSRSALAAVAKGVQRGRDSAAFVADLEVHARELLVVQTMEEVPAELSLTPEGDTRLLEQAERMPRALVVRTLDLLAAAMEAIRAGADSRTQLELALVKAANPEVDASTQALLARIERLEAQRGSTGSPAAPPRVVPSTPVPPRTAPEEEDLWPAGEEEPVAHQAPVADAASQANNALVAESAVAVADPESEPEQAQASAVAPDSLAEIPAVSCDLESIASLWPAVVDLIRSENALLGALIDEAWPVELKGDELVLAFAPNDAFLKKKAEDHANRTMVGTALYQLSGLRLRLAYELREQGLQERERRSSEPGHEDLVARLMAEFDAEELPRDSTV
jgi:DNA polymerase III subunit gamma/tau